ncbi:hypothetical protein EDD86DRAFT_206323 [Gorgonomyces haynaldii]|nr:hypothetical protein EDD86DRAFT_206323 [Gorgonomyces haynaldii]
MDRLLDLNLGGNKFDGLQTAWNFKPTKCVVGGSFCVNVTVPAVCGLSVCAAPTQTATPTPQSSVESSSPGLSVGAIVGIVAGAAFVLAIAIFAVFMIRRRTPKQDKRTTIVTLGQEDEMAVFRGNVSDYESMSRPAFSEYASSTKLAENAPHYSQFQTDPESETDLSNLSTMRADTLPKSGKFATLDEFYEALRHAGLSEDVLGHISQVFSQQSILPVHLKKLNDRKLKDLGIVQLGVRETILFVIFS